MIKMGIPAKEKRATKMARAKLGQLHRAQQKRDMLLAYRAEEEQRAAAKTVQAKKTAKK